MSSPSRSSSRTGPTLTAAGRRFVERRRIATRTRTVERRDTHGDTSRRAAHPRLRAAGPAGAAARAGAGPPRGRPGGRDAGGHGAALDRAGDRLPLGPGPGRRGHRRRRRPGALRRPHPGQAARHAAHPVRLPARPAAGGVGQRLGPGGRARWRPGWPRRSRPPGSPTTARPGSRTREPAVLRALAGGAALTAQEIREQVPAAGGAAGPRARQEVRRQRLDRAAGADPARGRGTAGPRRERRPLAALQAALDADVRLARRRSRRRRRPTRGTPSWSAAGCARSAPAPRPTSCGGWARPRPRSGRRWPRSAPSRCRWTAAAPAGCCPTTWSPSATDASSRGRRCCRCSTRR